MGMQRFTTGMSNGGMVRARDGMVLSDDDLRAAVPSIFATEAHESRSARFAPIATSMVLEGLRREGFDPVFAQQSRTRVPGKAAYTKHMLRMRHRGLSRADGEVFEIILLNANDGTCAYQMLPGFFRFVCTNGMMAGETYDEIKVRHSGKAVDEVIEGAYRVLDEAPKITAAVSEWKGITLSRDEREVFATAAHELRFPSLIPAETDGIPEAEFAEIVAQNAERTFVQPRDLLSVRRHDDRASDLWTTMNVVQENVIRGGQRGRITGSNGRRRNATVRAVTGIDQNKVLNRALWTLTEQMAALKQAA